ncbi:hypothetical protein HYQ46_008770 [Verticillium longisporum]|nr:hypothetical protein HYQ46_008770 [Verticillium longisporum]
MQAEPMMRRSLRRDLPQEVRSAGRCSFFPVQALAGVPVLQVAPHTGLGAVLGTAGCWALAGDSILGGVHT